MESLLVVTGAPGSGKSTAAELLVSMDHEFTVFDIDWLVDQASTLVGQRIQTSPDTWESYASLWFGVLHSSVKNSQIPIFFCPNSPKDFQRFGIPHWCSQFHWSLLDCDLATRQRRLNERGWSKIEIDEAVDDAKKLRQNAMPIFNTGEYSHEDTAKQILVWARKMKGSKV